MKKFIFSLMAVAMVMTSFGQESYKKNPSLAVHLALNDFQTASELRTIGLTNVLKAQQWTKTSRMRAGLALSYLQGMSEHLDFAVTATGSYVAYEVPNKVNNGNQEFLLEVAATANLKLTTDKYWVTPFLTGGVGATKYKGYYGAFVPVGLGIQVKLSRDAFILLNTQYRIKASENTTYNVYHSFGIAKGIAGPKMLPVVEAPAPPVVLDRDGDGVLDADDKCPDVAGLASLQGCPDRDGDGIADGDDKCPDVAGTAKYQGCPVPDTDGDGINDEMDKCPTVKGLARYQGCPIPDTDGDGVNDEEDKCPTRAGTAANQGCPEISKEVVDKINVAAKNIFFATGSDKLLAKSNKSLNEVAELLSADETLLVNIDGHTDITGKADKNQILSEARAASVRAYLISKGISESRLTATGYGIDKPIADNKTAAGRAKNRRVEMVVRNY